ncbi:molybdopterin cofactor-binding domain-containing protein [Lichenifustis flavocetrariae]
MLHARDALTRDGVLLIYLPPHGGGPIQEEPAAAGPQQPDDEVEVFLVVDRDGFVTGYNGHVDLGTGIGTALGQIVAEELDVAFEHVRIVLGESDKAPNQGATIASETIQVTAIPLRQAAAQARRHLISLAAERLDVRIDELDVENGVARRRDGGNASVSYAELLRDGHIRLALDPTVPLKATAHYRVVGQRQPRIDIPAKATGQFTYVHDVRLPGMLHGRVVRPPYAGLDAGEFVGNSLVAVDRTSIAHVPGLIAVVVIRDFVGVVAEREEQAVEAAAKLRLEWKTWPGLSDLDRPEQTLRAASSRPRVLLDEGGSAEAIAAAAQPMRRTYVWPYQMHGSIGPSCSVADFRQDGLTVWSGTQNPRMLVTDLARLLDLPEERIAIVRHEAAGCYGRNCADDVGADAALLSRAVGRPVRVQLSREQEHAWEPKGAAQVMDVGGGLDAEGRPVAYDFATRYPSNAAPTLALLLTGTIPAVPNVLQMGDRTAIPPYLYPKRRVVVHDMAPIVRASWLRGVSAMPNSFAHESFVDELATAAGVDPVAYRLRHLDDTRAIDLIKTVAEKAGWVPRTGPQSLPPDGDVLHGRGFAYAVYVHGTFPGTAAAWSAWVADVSVNRTTGDVVLSRVVVGQDSGLMINPAGVEHQIHGNVIQSTSRVLKEQVTFDRTGVTSREWGGYPILTFPEVPAIDVVMVPRPDEPPLGVGESASVPSAAAIANAIFDATGVRFREPPFTPDRILAALNPLPPPAKISSGDFSPVATVPRSQKPWRRWFGLVGAAMAGGLGVAMAMLPGRGMIAPITRPDPSVYAAATLARGRAVAALGNCFGCHLGPDGTALAGGHALATPFGTVYATNITPDPFAGIGAWSYPAFERAMREGLSRDGHHLYPAHPYTAFTRSSDADLQSLYAYLMAQPALAHVPPRTRLHFPFNLRPLLAAWNTLFLRSGTLAPDPSRSEAWNRGRELVEGLGHCSACHSPRNALGAEQGGEAHLAGAVVDGWEAPALTNLSKSPVPWTEAEFYSYLSTGHAPLHGVAAGPMTAVVAELRVVPDSDRRAMATYLASLQTSSLPQPQAESLAGTLLVRTAGISPEATAAGERIYAGACATCHEPNGPALFGARPLLALNTSVHSARPDNLIHVVLDGIATPAHPDLGAMPGFAGSFSDIQVADLLRYIRARFAPAEPAWENLDSNVARIRAGDNHS